MSPIKYPIRVHYSPVPVKVLLKNMKDFSSLMLDLAYYSISYLDSRLAKEVLRLEDYVDTMSELLVMQAALAVRDAEDAEKMVSVFRLASSTDKISDAAADIAMMVLSGEKIHPILGVAILLSDEVVSRVKFREGSKAIGKLIIDVLRENDIYVDIIALRRRNVWAFQPQPTTTKLELGDVLIVKGDADAVNTLKSIAKDYGEILKEIRIKTVEEALGMEIAELKDVVELMLDLAYHAITANDVQTATEVLELEDYVDGKHAVLERKAIESLKGTSTTDELLSIIRVLTSLESIADAAAELASIIVSGLEPHPILKSVIEESGETILKFKVGGKFDEVSIQRLNLEERGASIIAVRRGDRLFINPENTFKLKAGDTIILRCYAEAVEDIKGTFKDAE